MTSLHSVTRASMSLILALFASACDSRSPTTPRVPPVAPPPVATYTVSGIVTEMTPSGPIPVSGVRIQETSSQHFAYTDEVGLYSLPGLQARTSSIWASKAGYVTGQTPVTITGDTQLDIQVERIASYTLSGVVFEVTAAGRVPIPGVELYCDSCGSPDGHTFVYTDADGFYSFSWAFNGATPLLVRKDGYDLVDPPSTPVGNLRRIDVTVSGDTRVDIQMAPR
jgi:hypothetical protein